MLGSRKVRNIKEDIRQQPILVIFDFRAIKGFLFGVVLEEEFLEGGEVVGVDKVNAAGEQFLPEGVAGR